MKREKWTVTADDDGIRPAGPDDECFYCRAKVGSEHETECVIREQTVVIELTIEVVVKMPESWSDDAIEFKYNESSSCKSGLIEDIMRMDKRMRPVGNCLCGAGQVRFVREATDDDEERYQTFVKGGK